MDRPGSLMGAYRRFSGLDALLWRESTRAALRAAGLAPPDRTAATAEQDRPLARLVSDGLTSRQIVDVLDRTPKSVEGSWTRLLSRTGHRSRVELAAASLSPLT